MNSNMAYGAINTKIIAKKSRITNKEDWDRYLNCGSVEELTQLLKNNKEIGKVFEEENNSISRRVKLEVSISKLRRIEIENLLHYFSGEYKEFIKSFLLVEEINDLSLVISKLSREESLEDIKDHFIHSDKFTLIDFDDLLRAKNIDDLVSKLQGTIYYKGLSNLTKEDAINREFHIEMNLYLSLFRDLFDKVKKLNKKDREAAKDIIGFKIDLLNIQWIYRAKKYYNITPEEVFIYSLEGGKSIGYDKIKKLCYSNSSTDFAKLVNKYLKCNFFEDINDVEVDINSVVNTNMFNFLRNKDYQNIGTVISFIFMVEMVIDDLTSIVEGIKYKIPKEKLIQYLSYKANI